MYHRSAIPSGRMKTAGLVRGERSSLPNAPGIYHHVNKKTRKVEYVGYTDNLRRRQQQHRAVGKLNLRTQRVEFSVARPSATKNDLRETEKRHIARHKPRGNKYRGGNGR